jgi:hypothetical protein
MRFSRLSMVVHLPFWKTTVFTTDLSDPLQLNIPIQNLKWKTFHQAAILMNACRFTTNHETMAATAATRVQVKESTNLMKDTVESKIHWLLAHMSLV